MWLWLIFIFHAGATTPPTTTITVDYAPQQMGMGWIQIVMRAAEQVQVQHVIWCKSGIPNAHEPPPPDIDECRAPNLQQIQLFPSARPFLRDPPEPEPNTLYVNPDDLGGWDLQHQFNIIITGNKGAFQQVIRFNPLRAVTSTTTPIIMSTTTTTTMSTTIMTTEQATQGSTQESTQEPATPTPPIIVAAQDHPWLGASLFLASGLVLIALVTLIIRWRQIRRARPYAQLEEYQWDNNKEETSMIAPPPPPPGSEIEMMPLTRKPMLLVGE